MIKFWIKLSRLRETVRWLSVTKGRPVVRMKGPTCDFVFQSLIFAKSFTVPRALVLFTTEIFDSLIIEETVSMNGTSSLMNSWVSLYRAGNRLRLQLTESRSFISRLNFVRHVVRTTLAATEGCSSARRKKMLCRKTLLTVRKHNNKDNNGKYPFEGEAKDDESNDDIDECGNDVEQN